jgi:hypothetical protein
MSFWPFKKKDPQPFDSNPRCLSLLEDVECAAVTIEKTENRSAVFYKYTDGSFSVYVSVKGSQVSQANVEPGNYKLRLMLWPVGK